MSERTLSGRLLYAGGSTLVFTPVDRRTGAPVLGKTDEPDGALQAGPVEAPADADGRISVRLHDTEWRSWVWRVQQRLADGRSRWEGTLDMPDADADLNQLMGP